MKKLLFVTLLLCFAQMMQADTVDENVNITIGGETRNYQLYVPDNVQANCPLVLSLHGANGHSTDKSPFSTGVADTEGCIVAYPQGKVTAFPIGFGGSTTGWTASGEDNFDAEFLKAVIEDVASKYTIDRKHIYCCGFSNGGMMTYAMSNACSDIIAAFASISGYPINEFHLRHTSSRPVPFLHIHGKEDNFVLYSKVPTIVDEMVARLGANPVPTKTTVSGKYTKSVFAAGDGSFPYVFYEIDGMGHNDYTANTEDGNSALTMWNFFKDYTLDSSCDPTLKWRPRIETADFTPTSHGWTMNSGTTLLEFGGDQNTADNKNVYHSLQFNSGKYKLCFNSTGAAGKTITVKIQKLTSPNTAVLNTSVNVGENVELPFEVTDGWGEYKLTIIRPTASDAINVTDIAVYQTGEAEETMATPLKTIGTEFTSVEALSGKVFAIVNKAEGKAICNKQKNAPYDLQYLPYAEAFTDDVSGYYFKIEQINDEDDAAANGKYLIRCLQGDGSEYVLDSWAAPYFQTNITGSGVCFFFALSFGEQIRGLDDNNTAAWDIQYDTEHAAFTLKNVSTGKYYNDPTKDAMSNTPGYYTFCEVTDNIETVSIENPANLVTIALEQDQVESGDIHKASVSGPTDGVTTYTTTGGICIIIKTLDVDVAGCDYITYKFAEPIPAGIQYAVWSKNGNRCVPLEEGITEFKYVFADDPTCAIANNVIPQVCLLTVYAQGGKTVKVRGIYKHQVSNATHNRTYSFDQALDFAGIGGLNAYVIKAFTPETATLTLTRVTKVPANTGLYLVGTDGDHQVPVVESAPAIATNLLHASSGTDELNQTDGFYTNLIFGGTGDNRGFHPLSGAGIIGANKAYLQLPTEEFERLTSGARLSLVFEDETTVINTVNETMVADGAWYTLSGMKFNAKPTKKGIYINNGKKYAIQ